MSLRDYKAPTRVVQIDDENKLAIRALGFNDILTLLISRQGIIVQMIDFIAEERGLDTLSEPAIKDAAVQLLVTAPRFAAELIATAANEPDLVDVAMTLPAPTQLELLCAVGELTFAEPDSVKKFFDRLASLIRRIPRPTKTKAVLSTIGSEESGETLAS
jgi:hypothetical protein